jgi:S1-C subfamily serine protease
MKYIVGIAFIFMLMVGCGGLKTPVRSADALHTHIGNSTVALVRTVRGEVKPFCTGVWISDTEILTANHCIAHDDEEEDAVGDKVHYTIISETLEIGEEPAAIHLGYVKAQDLLHDLALIKAVVAPSHDSADLASEMPALGEHVYVVGHPKGLYWTYVEAAISAYRVHMPWADGPNGPFVQVNGTVWYGNSGGGVFDSNGNLVGIASRLVRVPEMSLFIHIDSVKKFIKEVHAPVAPLKPE